MLPLVLLSVALAASSGQPDLVLIMADDLGYGDVGCYHVDNPDWPDAPPPSSPTPQIDALAASGVRFLDFHAQPVCSPTRAALMTGRYPQRAGIDGVIFADPAQNRHHGLSPDEWTLPEALADSGYDTAAFGKWHLGYDETFHPMNQGFDWFVGYVSGNVDYVAHLDRMGTPDWFQGRILRDEVGYSTTLITDHAVDWINQAGRSPRLTYIAHECPHDPIQAPGDAPVRRSGHVGNLRSATGRERAAKRQAMIAAMDAGVGRVVDAVRESGRPTVVVFCSDNGAVAFGDNGPWRGQKGQVYEGGQRVPLIVAGFGLDDAVGHGDSAATCMTADLMPTLCELGQCSPRPNGVGAADGVSLAAVIRVPTATLPPRRVFQTFRNHAFVRDGSLKLVRTPRGGDELFDLATDPAETTPIDHPRKSELTAALTRWQADVQQGATQQPESSVR